MEGVAVRLLNSFPWLEPGSQRPSGEHASSGTESGGSIEANIKKRRDRTTKRMRLASLKEGQKEGQYDSSTHREGKTLGSSWSKVGYI